MLKIAIDVSPLNDGNSVRGVGYYTRQLVASLQSEVKSNPEYKNFTIDLISDSSRSLTGYDLVHYPYFDPFFLTLPPKSNLPTIITIHDIIPRQFKSHFPAGIRGEIKWLLQRHRARQADYIITVSHYSKYRIADIFNYPSDQIYVTPEAADPTFKPIKDKKLLASVVKKYKLPDKFVFYLGDINWNKNIPSLVNACINLNYPLVIAGSAAVSRVTKHPWTKDIRWLQNQTSPLLHLLGFVPDADLPSLFNLATIYCQPSYAEGFGLPLIQAMQSGTPVVYSQETSLPEIVDFNGEFFDPYNQTSLESALKKLWTDSKLRQKYSRQGIARAKVFSWQKTAIQTLAVYDIALNYEK